MKGVDTALSPVRVSGLDAHTVHCIACGESHMLAVIDNGSLAAWGSNEYGQLGKIPSCQERLFTSSFASCRILLLV